MHSHSEVLGVRTSTYRFFGDATQPITTLSSPSRPTSLSLLDFIHVAPFHASLPAQLLHGSSITFVTTRGGDLEDKFSLTYSYICQNHAQQMSN